MNMNVLAMSCRPVLELAEFWQDEKVEENKWMFAGDSGTKDDMKSLVDSREALLNEQIGPVKALVAARPACKNSDKLRWIVTQFDTMRREAEESGVIGIWHCTH